MLYVMQATFELCRWTGLHLVSVGEHWMRSYESGSQHAPHPVPRRQGAGQPGVPHHSAASSSQGIICEALPPDAE